MAKLRTAWLAAGTALVIAGAARAEEPKPFFPPFGLDLTAREASTPPGQDFFQYANGAWLARTPIPEDKPTVTMGRMLVDRTEGQLHEMIEDLARTAPAAPTTTEGKVGAFYAAFMDEARTEALGAKPIAPELDAIRAARTPSDLARLMGHTTDGFYGSPFNVFIDADLKDPSRYAAYVSQGGLGLPDRDYYLEPDFADTRAKYQAYVQQLLTLVGWPDPAGNAAKIMALETDIARASWTKSEQRDVVKSYNPFSPAELQALAPGFDWGEWLRGASLAGKSRVVIAEKSAFPKIAAVIGGAPTDTLKAWLAFQVADNAAVYLSAPFQQAHFELRDKALSGVPQQEARWKRAIKAVSGQDCITGPRVCFGTLGFAVGQAYAARYFPPPTKAKIEALVADLKTAFHARIEKLDWMSPATKAEALKKLDSYVVKVGYPDHPRDYSKVAIRRDDLIGDVRAAAKADWAFYVRRSSGPVDRGDWAMTPQTVDAYNGSLRDIVFPAAILQAPEFDAAADPAINYGAIGSIIGHEMTHGFDDQGRTIDAAGALKDWWTPEDAEKFKARAAVLGAQYARFEPVPGEHIRPELTMGENIADLGGLAIALDAYHASLKGQPAPSACSKSVKRFCVRTRADPSLARLPGGEPVSTSPEGALIGGLTGDQRLFLGFAQAWRGKGRDAFIRQQTVSDPHSWRKFRVDGVVSNIDAWYDAFGVKPGDAMYIPPDQRARIW